MEYLGWTDVSGEVFQVVLVPVLRDADGALAYEVDMEGRLIRLSRAIPPAGREEQLRQAIEAADAWVRLSAG